MKYKYIKVPKYLIIIPWPSWSPCYECGHNCFEWITKGFFIIGYKRERHESFIPMVWANEVNKVVTANLKMALEYDVPVGTKINIPTFGKIRKSK